MKPFAWNNEKNTLLQNGRGVTFEDIVRYIQNRQVLAVMDHPNQVKYPNQNIFIVRINDYAWIIPFVESDHEIFLKTAFPSRKMTKRYLRT
jgi:uncharacterized DUF497 family protein